jgi:hypothetical protein
MTWEVALVRSDLTRTEFTVCTGGRSALRTAA